MKGVTETIRGIWQDDSPRPGDAWLRGTLRLLALPYAAAVSLRNFGYDRRISKIGKLPAPVISVGNLAVGGTGKTPAVIAIATLLKQKGYKPAVLSRGYGGKTCKPVNIVSDGEKILLGWKEAGDEPVLIAKTLPEIPVLTGPVRLLNGKAAIEQFGADVLVLDDAFQHRSLCRDVDIVLLDRARPLGNGFLLPRGPLRENARTLSRATMIIRTGVADRIAPLPPGVSAPSFLGTHKPQGVVAGKSGRIESVERLSGQRVVMFAGIGAPEAFYRGVAALGAEVAACRNFPDHHRYRQQNLDELQALATKHAARLLTTEKDGVRLADFPTFLDEVSFLRISMDITPFEQFAGLLFSRLPY